MDRKNRELLNRRTMDMEQARGRERPGTTAGWDGLYLSYLPLFVFFSSRRRHTRFDCDWSSDVCSSDLRLYFMPSVPIEMPSLTVIVPNTCGIVPACFNEATARSVRRFKPMLQGVMVQIGRASCRERV